jgi:hypothetical protein
MGATSSSSSYVDDAIFEISDRSFASKVECSQKNNRQTIFSQRISGCKSGSNIMRGINVSDTVAISASCMQNSANDLSEDVDIESILKNQATAMVKDLGLNPTKAKSVTRKMVSLSSHLKTSLTVTMKAVSENITKFDQLIDNCKDDPNEKPRVNLMEDLTMTAITDSITNAMLKDTQVQRVKRRMTAQIDGEATAFIEGISMNLTWQMTVVLVVVAIVLGFLGQRYMLRVGAVVNKSIENPGNILLLISGLVFLILATITFLRYGLFVKKGK